MTSSFIKIGENCQVNLGFIKDVTILTKWMQKISKIHFTIIYYFNHHGELLNQNIIKQKRRNRVEVAKAVILPPYTSYLRVRIPISIQNHMEWSYLFV